MSNLHQDSSYFNLSAWNLGLYFVFCHHQSHWFILLRVILTEWLSQGAVVCNDKIKTKISKHKNIMKLQVRCVTGGYQRTRIDGSNMLLGCPNPSTAGDPVTSSTSSLQHVAQSRDLQARRGTVKGSQPSTAPSCWLSAKGVLLCWHSLGLTQASFSSELRQAQPAPVSLLDCGDVLKGVCDAFLSVHVPRVQLSHCINIWKLCWHFSLPSHRILTMNPAETAPSPNSTVDTQETGEREIIP